MIAARRDPIAPFRRRLTFKNQETDMSVLINEIAQHIRDIDPDNMLIPTDLGEDLSPHLKAYGLSRSQRQRVGRFLAGADPDRRLAPRDLAELIVDEFHLGPQTPEEAR